MELIEVGNIVITDTFYKAVEEHRKMMIEKHPDWESVQNGSFASFVSDYIYKNQYKLMNEV